MKKMYFVLLALLSSLYLSCNDNNKPSSSVENKIKLLSERSTKEVLFDSNKRSKRSSVKEKKIIITIDNPYDQPKEVDAPTFTVDNKNCWDGDVKVELNEKIEPNKVGIKAIKITLQPGENTLEYTITGTLSDLAQDHHLVVSFQDQTLNIQIRFNPINPEVQKNETMVQTQKLLEETLGIGHWLQKLEGKELKSIANTLKEKSNPPDISRSLTLKKKAEGTYLLDAKYYDEEGLKTLIDDNYKINQKGKLVSVNDEQKILNLEKIDDDHIKLQISDKSTITYFRAPEKIELLYGDWKLHPHYKDTHQISGDLEIWEQPKGNIENNKYLLQFLKERGEAICMSSPQIPSKNICGKDLYGGLLTISGSGVEFNGNYQPILSSDKSSVSVKDGLNNIKRIYILDYNTSSKNLTTLIWLHFTSSQYQDKFLKVKWKKQQ